jgi:hypothetical protein
MPWQDSRARSRMAVGMVPVGSRLLWRVPLNRTASWGMMVRAWRSLWRGMVVMSTPS